MWFLVCEGIAATHMWAHMNKVVREKGFEATLHDATENMGILSIQGPNRWAIDRKMHLENDGTVKITGGMEIMKNKKLV